jgi:NTF2 fold immunity protein
MRFSCYVAFSFLLVTSAVGQNRQSTTARGPKGWLCSRRSHRFESRRGSINSCLWRTANRVRAPLHATLQGDVWTVEGTLTCSDGKGGTTTTCLGGTAVVKLSKIDARILFMMHYK